MISTDNRTYSWRNPETGELDWFFYSREGEIGPYGSEDLAKTKLLRHIDRCQRRNLDGGRQFELTRHIHDLSNNGEIIVGAYVILNR